MVRPGIGEGQQPSRIVAPAAAFAFLAAKGFEEFDCAREGFNRPQQIEYRDFVCTIAAEQPEGMQAQFEGILGARPATLCGMAELVLGSWVKSEGVSS